MALKEKLKELTNKRAKAVSDARAIHKKAGDEKRALTAEDQSSLTKALDEADSIKVEIDKIEVELRNVDRIDEHTRDLERSRGRQTDPSDPGSGGDNPPADEPKEIRWKRKHGPDRVIKAVRHMRAIREYREAFEKFLAGGGKNDLERTAARIAERRDLQQDIGTDGGFLVTPLQMVASILQQVDDAVAIRQLATVATVTNAESLGVPTLETDASDPEWTAEIQTGSNDTAMKFGRRELKPSPLAKRIKISRKLLRTSAFSVEALVSERFAYKFGVANEKGFLTGSGVNQPLGLFTASASGISTGRDVSTGNTTTAVTADGLKTAKYALKAQYMMSPTTRWIFHRDIMRQIALLKDGENRYLWEPNIRVGDPDTLYNIPVVMSEFAPSTSTTGLYVGLVGDIKYYYIADALSMDMQRLDELYAESNQVGFIARAETDGMPALEEAFARVKLA